MDHLRARSATRQAFFKKPLNFPEFFYIYIVLEILYSTGYNQHNQERILIPVLASRIGGQISWMPCAAGVAVFSVVVLLKLLLENISGSTQNLEMERT
jgi:hypothetical protein